MTFPIYRRLEPMRFTSISQLMHDDKEYLKEAFDGTRFKLMSSTDSYYYALTYGDTKNRGIEAEIESELASLGAYTISTSIYWEVPER